MDSVPRQPTEKQFAPPNQPDVNPNDARAVEYNFSLLTGMKCVFDPKSRSDSGTERADPAGVSAERFQAVS